MAHNIITVVCMVLLAQGFVHAVNVPRNPSQVEKLKIIQQQPLTFLGTEVLATTVEITLPPGDAGSQPHSHSGPIVGYVIKGEFLFQMQGELHRIIRAGEAFFEREGAVHVWDGNASNNTVCKILATVYGRPGKDFVTFVKHNKHETREEAIAAAKRGQQTSSAHQNVYHRKI